MPECQYCGSHVADPDAMVSTPPTVEQPRASHHCQDTVRSGAEVRESHSTSS